MPDSAAATQIAIAVVLRDDQVLIGLRPEGVPLAGYWEFPGGKVHDGERLEDAVRRECREETGLQVVVKGPYPSEIHQYQHGTVHLHFFRCAVDQANATQPPRRTFQWVPRRELDQYEFPEANRDLIRQLVAASV